MPAVLCSHQYMRQTKLSTKVSIFRNKTFSSFVSGALPQRTVLNLLNMIEAGVVLSC